MIPKPGQYLSLLMGAPSVTDAGLTELGIEILERFGSAVRGLLVPDTSVVAYLELLRKKLQPGFWNDLVGPNEIRFLFRLRDGTSQEFTLSKSNRDEIARLCSDFNGDPLERTSDLPNYFAANPFYRETVVAHHGATAR